MTALLLVAVGRNVTVIPLTDVELTGLCQPCGVPLGFPETPPRTSKNVVHPVVLARAKVSVGDRLGPFPSVSVVPAGSESVSKRIGCSVAPSGLAGSVADAPDGVLALLVVAIVPAPVVPDASVIVAVHDPSGASVCVVPVVDAEKLVVAVDVVVHSFAGEAAVDVLGVVLFEHPASSAPDRTRAAAAAGTGLTKKRFTGVRVWSLSGPGLPNAGRAVRAAGAPRRGSTGARRRS